MFAEMKVTSHVICTSDGPIVLMDDIVPGWEKNPSYNLALFNVMN
jgi:hypothetical protein